MRRGEIWWASPPELFGTDSVVNVAQVLTIDKHLLTEVMGKLPDRIMEAINGGLKLVIRE